MKLNWKTCLKVAVSIFLLYLAIYYWPSVSALLGTLLGAAGPLLVGGVIAFVLNILMNAYERLFFPKSKKKGVKRIRTLSKE